MVKFCCFLHCIHGNKPKRTVQPSIEAMAKTLEDGVNSQVSTSSSRPSSSRPLLWKETNKNKIHYVTNHGDFLAPDPVECNPQSKDPKSLFMIENEKFCQSPSHKSQSLETDELYKDSGVYTDNSIDGVIDLAFSYVDSENDNELTISGCGKDQKANPTNHYKINPNSEFQVFPGHNNDDDTMFSIGDPTPSLKEVHEIYSSPVSAELAGRRQKEICIEESEDQIWGEHAGENNVDNSFHGVYDSYPFSGIPKDWTMPVVGDMNSVKILQGVSHFDKLPHKDYQIKRTKDWVNSLQHYEPSGGKSESSRYIDSLNGDANNMMHGKVPPGMASAMRYISLLSANATVIQLANHGLVVNPFLCAFESLKVLNLSRNAIVRIAKGALPHGLHILNLSRNKISNIEGLRELTRLCVLDLSYNRLLKIGQGLASCSSLKELYLAGNKISGLEGLHRLFKLTVLDLKFNKISTAKCFGQLAANYNSLKVISLQGNPAQKYIGDEQLKKYLLSFLPFLVYYNSLIIKTRTSKAATSRSSWDTINSHDPISLYCSHR